MNWYKISQKLDIDDYSGQVAYYRKRVGNLFTVSIHPELLEALDSYGLGGDIESELGKALADAATMVMRKKISELNGVNGVA